MTDGAARNILLIDDQPGNPYFSKWVVQPLEKKGWDVTVVRNGAEAWEVLSLKRPLFNLVIIDLQLDELMPEELAPYTRAIQPHRNNRAYSLENSGQAIGLWLWAERTTKKIPYGYLTSHPGLYVQDVRIGGNKIEFEGKAIEQQLLCPRGSQGIVQFAEQVLQCWQNQNWTQ